MANFDMYFLVLRTVDGELIKTEASSKENVKEMLEILKEKNTAIEIGYKKQEEQPYVKALIRDLRMSVDLFCYPK